MTDEKAAYEDILQETRRNFQRINVNSPEFDNEAIESISNAFDIL